ncbi:MAG: electron transfer flavoprotein subunit beta/FixA family protein [Clostridia bacterium]|nr:electron transfer flavoprotein subunit beta/FixA family protein [Clostridia bacterium]
MLTIVVCVKQVFDPEAPLSLFQLCPEGKKLIPPPGTPPVLSSFDENALEAALYIKDVQAAKVIVVSMGYKLAKPVLKKTLAAGADELILLEDEQFEGLDSYSTAHVLARAIERIGNWDIILCGRQAADTDAGQVGAGIAEILQIPGITLARKVEIEGEKVRVERLLADGYEVVETARPVLITASNEIGALRFPNVKALMAAQKMGVTVWDAAELGLTTAVTKQTNLLKLFVPERNTNCQMISGENPEETAEKLTAILAIKVGGN